MKIETFNITRPLHVQYEITDNCNLRCIHCYNLSSDTKLRKPKNNNRSKEIVQRLIDNNIFEVTITGGEPLVNKTELIEIISMLKENGIKVYLNTNLILMDDHLMDFLESNSVNILTSCPSVDRDVYKELMGVDCLHIFLEKLKMALKRNIRTCVNVVVSKINMQHFDDTIIYLHKMGCYALAVSPMTLNMNYPRFDLVVSINDIKNIILPKVLEIKKRINIKLDMEECIPKCIIPQDFFEENFPFLRRSCSAGYSIAIACDGSIKPCTHISSIDCGNILTNNLSESYEKLKSWRERAYVPSRCKECSLVKSCQGGCRAQAKTANGNWDSEDIWMDNPIKNYNYNYYAQSEVKPLTSETLLTIIKDCPVREEKEGIYTFYDRRKSIVLTVNNHFYLFIKSLFNLSGNNIKLAELAKIYGTDVSSDIFLSIINFLIKKHFISIVD